MNQFILNLKKCSVFVFLLLFFHSSISNKVANFHNRYIASLASTDSMKLLPQGFAHLFKNETLPLQSLITAINSSLEYFQKIPPSRIFHYGKIPYTAKQIVDSLNFFKELAQKYHGNKAKLLEEISKNYYVFGSSANYVNKGVLFTGYYEPIYRASLKKTTEYNVPVYKRPPNLKVLSLGRFRHKLYNRTIVYRLAKNNDLLPYYTREEIMDKQALANLHLEIAWMKDPIELLFLQIQGSGILQLTDNSYLRIGYNGSNGRPYHSIGKYLVRHHYMKLEDVSMQSIHNFLHATPSILKQTLFFNPSYTFFRLSPNQDAYPVGNLGVPLTPERSIAIDQRVFPAGALSYLVVYNKTKEGKEKTKKFSHFSLAQDTGGAIRGARRVDIFLGSGENAGDIAGEMRNFGHLYFLIKKQNYSFQLN